LAVDAQLRDVAFDLPPKSEVPSTKLLVGRVKSLQQQVFQEAVARREEFASVDRALNLLAEMGGANGPRRYLIAVANSAEMRGTGGMMLNYGVLSSNGGHFSLDAFGPIDQLQLNAPATVDPAPGYVTRFAGFDPTKVWRNANLGADFPSVASVEEAMYQAATGNAVDGVIQVDPNGLAALLQGIGPVQVPNIGEMNAGNVVAFTLNGAYTAFPDRPIRQEALGAVAETVFRTLVTGSFPSLRPLATALVQAAATRHVMFASTSELGERLSQQLAASGSLPTTGDFAELTVQNVSANKLDYYLDTGLRLTGDRRAGRPSTLHAVITVANTAPPGGKPAYVFGPNAPDQQAGVYKGLVSLYLPPGASVASSSGQADAPPRLDSEGESSVITFGVTVPAGQQRQITLDLALAPRAVSQYFLQLVPAPRVRPTTYDVDLTAGGPQDVRFNGPLEKPAFLLER